MITRNDATNVRQVQVYTVHVSEQQIALTERGLETPLRRFVCVQAIIYYCYCSGRVPSCDEHGLLHSTST
jgi:hypothetical protein